MKKNFKFFALTALFAGLSMSAFAQEKATTVWRYTVSGNDATLIGFVADLGDAGKADVTIPNKVTDPTNASVKYTVKAINEDAFSISNDKGKLKKLTIAAEELTAIPAKLIQDCGNLTELDLSGAKKLAAIPDGALKGTKIESLDLSKTKVNSIGNLFGTNYEYIATGGTYTEPEANAANVAWLTANGQSFVKEGDPILSTGTFNTYGEINAYYKQKFPGAKEAGDIKPMDKKEANAANKGKFGSCVVAGDDVIWTLATALAWNVANVKGAMDEGYVLDEVTAGVYNTALGITTKKDGDVLTANEAQAYNEKLASGTVTYKTTLTPGTNLTASKVAVVGKPAFDETGANLVYTDDTAYAYNLANQPGCFVVGDDGATSFSTHYEAWCWNNDNVVPAGEQKALGESGTVPSGSYYTASQAYTENLSRVPTANQTKTGDSKAGVKIGAVNNNTFKSLTLNNTWTIIATGAFENCTALATVNFGTAVKEVSSQTIGDRAFLGSALTEVNLIGTKVSSLSSDTFVDFNESWTDKANKNATITSVKFNKIFASVSAGLFANCTALATVEFEEREIATESAPGNPVTFKVPFTGIGAFAFANTAIESIEVPQALNAALSSNVSAVASGAFYNCQNLKSFTYMIDNETSGIYAVVDAMAFPGCSNVAYITTNANVAAYMAANADAPKNTYFEISSGDDSYVTPFTPVEFKKQPGKYYIKYVAAADIRVKKDEAKVYDAYTDDTDFTLNMTLYKASGSYYNIKKGSTVLILTDKKDLTFETKSGIVSGSFNGASNALRIVTVKGGIPRAALDFLAGPSRVTYGWVNSAKAGTGFQKISSGETFPQGTMYVFAAEPADGARLNVVWRDENGNIDSDPTAIESVINVEEDQNGEIYNLQGIRVNEVKKGLFIKNGKKYVVK